MPHLVVFACVLSNVEDTLGRDGEEEASDVVHLCLSKERLPLLCLQMAELVVVGSREVGNERSVVVRHELQDTRGHAPNLSFPWMRQAQVPVGVSGST